MTILATSDYVNPMRDISAVCPKAVRHYPPRIHVELRERYLLLGERSPQETSTYRDHSPQSVEEKTPSKDYRTRDLNLVRADQTTPEKRNPYPVGVICPPHSTHSIASLGHSPHALAKQLGKGQGTGPA